MNATAAACPVIATADRTLHLVTPAELAGPGLPWVDAVASFAGKPDRWRADQALITGRFVQGGVANLNGHEYDPTELVDAHQSIVHTATNIGHDKPTVVGTFIATEVDDGPDAVELGGVIINAAAVYWKRNRPDLWPDVEAAARMGLLFFSKEAVARTITCMDHCGQTFRYAGPTHPSYCAALQRIGPRARLNQPIFTGGALVVPPQRPGWAHAAVDTIIQAHAAEATAVYDAIAARAPDLDAADWERAMAAVLIDVYPAEAAAATPRRVHVTAFDPIVTDLFAEAACHDTDPAVVAAMVGADPAPTVTSDDNPGRPLGAVIVANVDDTTRAALAAHPAVTVDADELHCTLAYLGKADTNPDEAGINRFRVGDVPARRVEAVAAAVAAVVPPLSGVISGFVAWDEGDDTGVIVALVDVPALSEARALLVDALTAARIPYANGHGFTAHITVAKVPADGDRNVAGYDDLRGTPVTLDTWGVWWGTARRATYQAGEGIA